MQLAFQNVLAAGVAAASLTLGDGAVAHTGTDTAWLHAAVMRGFCPARPVNLPAAVRGSVGAKALRARVSLDGGTLTVEGLADRANHVVLAPSGTPGKVTVRFDGVALGAFGPVTRAVVRGGRRNDALRVEAGLGLPVALDGAGGDDCLQAGSGGDVLRAGDGDDVLVAGAGGRPALDGGNGYNRLVLERPLGGLWATAAARAAGGAGGALVARLAGLHGLRTPPAPAGLGPRAGLRPLLLGAGDLRDGALIGLARRVYAAGEAVALVPAGPDAIERLRRLLGHPGRLGPAEGERPGLVFFRKTPRPSGGGTDYRIGTFAGDRSATRPPLRSSDFSLEVLSQAFADQAIPPAEPAALAASSPNDLLTLADSYSFQSSYSSSDGKWQLASYHSAWAVRSFTNETDFFYIDQTAVYYRNTSTTANTNGEISAELDSFNSGPPSPVQTSPQSTTCTTSTTSGVNWSIGGSAGWTQDKGFNAALTGGVQVVNTKTINCPSVTIINVTNPSRGKTRWQYSWEHDKPMTQYFYNQWVWAQPWKSYDNRIIQEASYPVYHLNYLFRPPQNDAFTLDDTFWVPLPFGTTFTLEPPVVSAVSPTCVAQGQTFRIAGTGLYPGLLTGVTIGGAALGSGQYSAISDTAIDVAAPVLSGNALPVVVKSQIGLSNSDVTIKVAAACP